MFLEVLHILDTRGWYYIFMKIFSKQKRLLYQVYVSFELLFSLSLWISPNLGIFVSLDKNFWTITFSIEY